MMTKANPAFLILAGLILAFMLGGKVQAQAMDKLPPAPDYLGEIQIGRASCRERV